jgi:hypothetical protein
VTFDQAIAELGLEADADADTARRAYLRLIKVRKPETDPEGFQRAREAYEVVRGGAELTRFTRVMREARRSGGKAAVDPQAATAGPTDPPRQGHRPETPSASVTPAAADAAFAGFLRIWEAIPPHADRVRRMEVAREAVAALPADPRAHWLLVKSLSGWAADTILADALREAHRRGHPGFLEMLLIQAPHRALREDIDEGIRSDDPSMRLAGAAALASWDPAAGAAVVVDL